MGQERVEYDRNRLNLSERLVAEMFLLAYVFIFFLGETGSAIPYIWLLISIACGISAYFIFYSRPYSIGPGIGLALALTMPLFLFGTPIMNVLLFFVYVFWRINVNFNGSRIQGWPFITVANTGVFLSTYLLARLIFVNNGPEELMRQLLIIYLLTSFLFYFIRMVTITFNSWRLGNFKVREAGKVFSIIIGLGASVFYTVLYGLEHARLLIIKTLGFLFGGLFMSVIKGLDPLFELIRKGTEDLTDENAGKSEFGFFDFEERESTSSIFEYSLLAFVVAVLVILTVILIVKKKNERYYDRQETYYFSFKGKKEPEPEQRLLYDYSTAQDEVRRSFEKFEREAQESKLHRYPEETVMEWFTRMGWAENERILSMYNAVRYSSYAPSENERNDFIMGLKNIKKVFLK